MKTKIIIALLISSILRWVDYALLNADPVFYLSSRNFNGRGLLVVPSWLDVLIPIIVIAFLWKRKKTKKTDLRDFLKPIGWAMGIVVAGIAMRYLLSNYIYKNHWFLAYNKLLVLKYFLFILTFWAIQSLADRSEETSKYFRFMIMLWGIIVLGLTQDMFATAQQAYKIMALFNSLGLSAILISWGLRPFYIKNPIGAFAGAALAGLFIIFQVVSAESNSFFTFFMPFLAMLTMAWLASRKKKNLRQMMIALMPFLIALFLNYVLPKIVPPAIAQNLIEKPAHKSIIHEQYRGITIEYPSKDMARFVRQLADVIVSANHISRKTFGVSPDVNELVITGIGPGGFHAEFPHRIVGKIIDTLYMKRCLDSSFLNEPSLRADFPDPINAILHEYSHLYGVIPYHKWLPGPEEEGWATYSATRLAKLLYNNNPKLWNPSYNFDKQADKITEKNLHGRAVAWSHPNEFGGFILWYHIGKSIGLKKLYITRWEISKHDMNKGLAYYYSDPQIALNAIDKFGKRFFVQYGQYKPVRFGKIYSIDDWLYMAKTCGMDISFIRQLYERSKNQMINPSVPIP